MNSTKRSSSAIAIGYIRKSTDTEDKQVRSLEDQERLIRDYHETLDESELQIMSEARSAYRPGRPVFDEIMTMADRGQVNRIIVLDPTRLSRNPEDTGKLIQRLAEGKIQDVMTVSGKTYSRIDTGQLFMLTLENTMSWKDSADKGVRVRQAMDQKAKEGGSIGPAPIGYMNAGQVKGNKWIEIDPIAAPKVKALFTLASTGACSLNALTLEAVQLGIRSRPTRRHPDGLPLQKTTVHQILRNPTYKGMRLYKGALYRGRHEPLINPEMWERVQLALSGRSTHTSRSKEPSSKTHFVMAGCVVCGVCRHYSMSPYFAKQGRYIFYGCQGRNTKCSNSINQDKLLEQLYSNLASLSTDESERKSIRKEMTADFREKMSNKKDCRASLVSEMAEVDRKAANLFLERESARKMGFLEGIDAQLAALKRRKEELTLAIQNAHDSNEDWIDHTIRCLELEVLATEAIQYGSPMVREAILKSLGSNYYVKSKILIPDWHSPFRQKSEKGGCTIWLPRLDSNQ